MCRRIVAGSITMKETRPLITLFQGFRFGMLIQLAVGPVCLYVFATGSAHGFMHALAVVAAVALVDAAYILLAVMGVAVLLKGRFTRAALRFSGAAVLVFFGTRAIMAGIAGLPGETPADLTGGPFVSGLVLTASNPLTVLFWSGVFSARLAQDGLAGTRLFHFSAGCVLATLVFLAGIALASSMMREFLPGLAVRILNAAVGFALIVFAVIMLVKGRGAQGD